MLRRQNGPLGAMRQDSATIAWRWELVFEYKRVRNYEAVARKLSTTPRTVSTWVQRYHETGDVRDKARSGRPRIDLSAPDVESLLKEGIREGMDCTQLLKMLSKEKGIVVGMETVRLHLNAHLARQLRPKKKPRLTESHKQKRLAFSKAWVDKDWSNVAVSDSKMFYLCQQGIGSKQWVLYEDEPPELPAYKNCSKVHAYAAVTKWGKTQLFFTAGTTGMKFPSKGVNAKIYVELLDSKLIPAIKHLMANNMGVQRGRPWVLQQDNAPAHTAKVTKAWLAEQGPIHKFQVMQWPPNSPDLSWIENLWGVVSMQLAKRRDLTPRNFMHQVVEEWNKIPSQTYMAMYHSIKKRLQACIANKGGRTKY